ncbi:AAA family ATPase [Clostridium sp. P21]|uniref:Nuclease SbcCD subunit C n=1 Tax=Clostridium muellerianum TaxID=2716538 RepID=A0A7Y0EFW4_9CLOT|nr:AAA family ATPase [Clostridium muellerianum]NMM62705.1 AAA family ATPase [Clostridium muellerianum]
MRPLKLTMTAFGPYAKKQEIDFTNLNGRNIFLITGPTGAGKTTIFDGISYAIYGEASGEDRDSESLRSQFADIDTLTSVELEFNLRGVDYYIKRIPKQEKKKARGEGLTEQKTDAEMKIFKSNGDIKVISGVSNVNEQINEIMGINYDQFKQIMMIPQGEFRKLLTSESKDREKILQKIFGTEAYKLVEIKLNEMAGKIKRSVNELQHKENEIINTVQCDDNEVLMELIESDNKNVFSIIEELKQHIESDDERRTHIEKSINEKGTLLEKKQKEILEAKENNKKFEEKNFIEAEKKSLEDKESTIEEKKNRLLKARKAIEIVGIEENYTEKTKKLQMKRLELVEKKEAINLETKNLKKAEESFKFESSREEERKKLLEDVTVLKGYISKVRDFEDKRERLKVLEERLKLSEKDRFSKKQDIDKVKKDIDNYSNELELVRKSSEKYVKLSMQLEKVTGIYNKIHTLDLENKKLIKIRGEYVKYKNKAIEDRKVVEKAELNFKELERLFREGQAGLLAKNLEDGMPCPVCGSIHHTKLAVLEQGVPTEAQLKIKKDFLEEALKKFEKSNESFIEADVNGRSQNNIVSRLKEELQVLIQDDIITLEKDRLTDFIKEKFLAFEENKKNLTVEVQRLEKEKNKQDNILKVLNEKRELQLKNEKSLEELNNKYQLSLSAVEREKGILNQIADDIPEKFRREKDLINTIAQMEYKQTTMEKSLKDSQEHFNNLKLKYEKLIIEKEGIIKALEEGEISLKYSEDKLNEGISKRGFKDLQDYRESKLSEKEEEELNKYINDFNEQLRSIKDRYIKILKDIEGKSLLNISILENDYENVKREREILDKQKTELHAKIEINNNAFLRIKELNKEIKDKEKQYSIVGDLAEAAKGNNSERMTFERYVLAFFFDSIIEAANIRFARMTESRYELDRIKEKGKGLTQSGLELQVYDNYTGKYRHVKTLSGGEGFKASLSLALGLSDIVQCYSGGISLETMFIDEGFGTLDAESLENAVQCLIDLQSTGRLVGIISHVPELKERIDARLEIIPGAEGSTAKFNIL